MAKKKRRQDPLAALLTAASSEALTDLIVRFASSQPDVRRELRSRKMEVGPDYHDLATYYWDQGDREQALDVAEQGIQPALFLNSKGA